MPQLLVTKYMYHPKRKKEKEKVLRNGLRQVHHDYNHDIKYSAHPGKVTIHENKFKNIHYIPALDNDFGLLWVMKNKLQIPDVAYMMGFYQGTSYLNDGTISPDYKICVKNNGKINFCCNGCWK